MFLLLEFFYMFQVVSLFRRTSGFRCVTVPYSVRVRFRQYLFSYLFLGFPYLFFIS